MVGMPFSGLPRHEAANGLAVQRLTCGLRACCIPSRDLINHFEGVVVAKNQQKSCQDEIFAGLD